MYPGVLFILLSLEATEKIEGIPQDKWQPLGSQQGPNGAIDEVYSIEPKLFFEKYVKQNRPVLIRHALKETKPVQLWNDKYLAENHGETEVNVDFTKIEDRLGESDAMPMIDFLQKYNNSKYYLVSTLPHSMQEEFPLPFCLSCSGFLDRLQDFVLWFSSGGTKSSLHYDNVENMYCQVSGTKQWLFVDPVNGSKHIPLDHPEGHYCGVNVTAVDFNRYPTLRNMPWWKAEVETGDCLYVPLNWWHQVNSGSNRNMAVNIWWAPLHTATTHFRCQDQRRDINLADLHFNFGEWIRFSLIELANSFNGKLNFTTMYEMVVDEHTGKRLITTESFKTLDTNSDNFVDVNELSSSSAIAIHSAVQFVKIGTMNVNGRSNIEAMESSASNTIQTHDEF